MKTQKKTAGRWLLELLSLLFAIVLLSTLTVMGFIPAMGCGWSGSCSKYGVEVLLLLAFFGTCHIDMVYRQALHISAWLTAFFSS